MKLDVSGRWLPVLIVVLLASVRLAQAEEGYGSIKGQFVLDGEIPAPTLLVKKGDAAVKDPAVCAAQDVYSDELIVDPETKGIANIFIYIFPPQAEGMKIHPDLAESETKTLVFDQKNCRFTPHAMLVRTDQTVIVKSDDSCAHNTHTLPGNNMASNFIVSPKDREGVEVQFRVSERYVTRVQCDIHNWMSAWWLILEHPYAAITDEKGNFTIEKLPVGEHEFRVWHEKSGWIEAGEKRGFKVKVESDQAVDLGARKVPVAALSGQ
jgi:hypothetical protein